MEDKNKAKILNFNEYKNKKVNVSVDTNTDILKFEHYSYRDYHIMLAKSATPLWFVCDGSETIAICYSQDECTEFIDNLKGS